jgi:4-hydroxybenzoate polyprenyltransferase
MNLDELKTAWQEFDRKLVSTQAIQERIIITMLAERSSTTLTKARRYYLFGLVTAAAWLLFSAAVLSGNPFDFRYVYQYIPIAIMALCFLVFLILFVINYRALSSIQIHHANLAESLRSIIDHYEKPKKLLTGILYTYLAAAFSFPLSFLPPKIERVGVWPALGETLIPITISLVILFIAHMLGAFKEHHKEKFQSDLSELQELKAMSAELQS